MIPSYCLQTHLVLWLSGKSAFLGNRRSLVQIRAVPHIILLFIIMFTMFLFQNDFHLLSNFLRGAMA